MNIKIETTDEFFKSGKLIAKLADIGLLKQESKILSFEDAEDLANFISTVEKDISESNKSSIHPFKNQKLDSHQ